MWASGPPRLSGFAWSDTLSAGGACSTRSPGSNVLPPTRLNNIRGRAADPKGGDPTGDWRRERWAARRNREWAKIIDAWAQLLSPDGETTLRASARDLPGIDAEFVLSGWTAWSRPADIQSHRRTG